MSNRDVFLDRDGVINELVYHQEQGVIDSPFTVEQFRLLPGVGKAITKFHEMGYMVIVVSNQPGTAKGHLSWETFDQIRQKMNEELDEETAFVDREYHCFHHPEAKVHSLRAKCECRKPKPGLLLEAAQDIGVDLSQSWMIGDSLTDIKAGKDAGCQTILLGRMKCESCRLMDKECTTPDFICADLLEATERIRAGAEICRSRL